MFRVVAFKRYRSGEVSGPPKEYLFNGSTSDDEILKQISNDLELGLVLIYDKVDRIKNIFVERFGQITELGSTLK
jgi:hypothetical protein